MSWSYDPNLSTDRDRVRFLIGDTDTNDQLLSDEELDYLLTQYSVYEAAAVACEAIAAKYARKADKEVGDLSIKWSQVSDQYTKKAQELRKQAKVSNPAVPFAGAISISQKETVEADADRTIPAFSRDQFDNEEIY